MQDRGAVGGELKRVAVAARDEGLAAAPLLGGDRSGEEIVGFVAGRLGEPKAAGRDKLRQYVELLDDLVVELAAALIGREQLLAVGRRAERVPADQHGARPLGLVEAQQQIGKADDRAAATIAAAADRFR